MSNNTHMYLIGNAHIDPVWLWRWQDGYTEVLNTFRSVLDRMNEFPELKFSSACSLYYQWVEKSDPAMFEEIKARVKEGRWNIVGGWVIQPDCNIPSGESFARHALLSQRYFREKFGVTVKSGYNVDSFGHNASLPMILRASGMENYVFMRPDKNENGTLCDLFNWESADGSSVTTYRIPLAYTAGFNQIERIEEVRKMCDEDVLPRMSFFGLGNHGGGPSIRLLDKLKQMNLHDTSYATVDEYFGIVKSLEKPTIKNELQHHAIGCYSAESSVKAKNRQCEENIAFAERICTVANELTSFEYPHDEIDRAWKNVLFNQFHDIMGGCSIRSAYPDAHNLYGETMSITERIINEAMVNIARNVDTLGDNQLPSYKRNESGWLTWSHETLGTPVLVFNPHAHKVRAAVKIAAVPRMVTDEKGNKVPFQRIRGEQTNGGSKHSGLFIAEVEPLGYAVYRIFCAGDPIWQEPKVSVTEATLENSKLAITFDTATGEIASIFDKASQKYIIDKPCATQLLDETECDTWAHAKDKLGETVGAFGAPTFTVKENGPNRAVLNIISSFGESKISRNYILLSDSDMLTVETEVDFHEKHKALKLSFPIAEDRKVLAEIPYGTIERSTCGYEDPFGKWLATGNYCVTTDGKYGYDTDEQYMRITALRGAIYADHYGHRDEDCRYMEQGISTFSYAIFPRTTVTEAHQKAAEFNCPPRALVSGFTRGKLPERKSCITLNDGTFVTAVKKSRYHDGSIVRFIESEGQDKKINFSIFDKNIEAEITHNSLCTFADNGDKLNLLEDTL